MYCDRLHAWWLTCYEVNSSYSAVIAVNTCALVIGFAMAHPCTYKCALVPLMINGRFANVQLLVRKNTKQTLIQEGTCILWRKCFEIPIRDSSERSIQKPTLVSWNRRLHYLICIFPRWPPIWRKNIKNLWSNLLRMPNWYKSIHKHLLMIGDLHWHHFM